MSLETRLRSTARPILPAAGGASSSTAGLVQSSRTISTVFPLSGGGNLSADRTFSADTAFLINSGRTVSALYPLAGGGNLSADRTLSADTAFLVNSGRTISTLYPISGGGDLSANRTVSADTAFLVTSSRSISTTYPLAGGGDFSTNRTHTVDTAFLVNSSRLINTTYPLAGGGNLSADRTHTVDTAFLVNTARQVISGNGLSGGGDLSADRTLSVNTNVRDKIFGFFFAGSLSTLMLASSAMIYIPFNMELRDVRAAVSNSATGANILYNPLQWNAALTATTAMFASANRPFVFTNQLVGSNNGTFAIGNLYAGSWLGMNIDQVGSTIPGSNLTVTFIVRTS